MDVPSRGGDQRLSRTFSRSTPRVGGVVLPSPVPPSEHLQIATFFVPPTGEPINTLDD